MGRVRARTRRGDNNHPPYDTSYGEINGGLRCRQYRSPIGKSDCGATVELRVRVIAAVMIGQLHSRVGALL